MIELAFRPPLLLLLGLPSEVVYGRLSKCRRADKSPLTQIDELLAHGEHRDAFEQANLMACRTGAFARASEVRGPIQYGETAAMLRLQAGLAALRGGSYDEGRGAIKQAEYTIEGLKPSPAKALLSLNRLLLATRLAQASALPDSARVLLGLARQALSERTIKELELATPRGFDLLDCRNDLQFKAPEALARLRALPPVEREPSSQHILGQFAAFYFHYLVGLACLSIGNWDLANEQLTLAEAEAASRHDGQVDQVRHAYLRLARARARIGSTAGQVTDRTGRQTGTTGLLDVRSQFRRLRFAPGEYLAYRTWLDSVTVDEESRDHFNRELWTLAKSTGVWRFRLDAAVRYAESLRQAGRPVTATAILSSTMAEPCPLTEAASDPDWNRAKSLEQALSTAATNAVAWDQPWGMSAYAHDELAFVKKASVTKGIVSTSGPTGSGRRVLLERIFRSRGLERVSVVTADRRQPHDIPSEIQSHVHAGRAIILRRLDTWPPDLQRQIAPVLQALDHRLLGVSLTRPLRRALDESTLVAEFSSFLLEADTWDIQPLAERPKDVLLMARGFLIRALERRDFFPDSDTIRRIVFSSSAAKLLRDRRWTIAGLYEAMGNAATYMREELDLYDAEDGFKRVALSAVARHVAEDDTRSRASVLGGIDVLNATHKDVAALAEQYKGKLAALARDAGVSRSTLVYQWETLGLMPTWKANGGRKRRLTVRKPQQR